MGGGWGAFGASTQGFFWGEYKSFSERVKSCDSRSNQSLFKTIRHF